MAKDKPKRGRPSKGKRVSLHIYVSQDLKDALVELAERNRRDLTGEASIALEYHVKRNAIAAEEPAEE